MVNAIQNAEIYISPNIDSIEEEEECTTSNSTNSQSLYKLQNKTCSEISSLLDSEFYERRIVEEANNSATSNNELQFQILKNAKVDTITRQQRKMQKSIQ